MPTTVTTDSSEQREQLVALLRRRGITDPAVCKALQEVPREEFVPAAFREFAYHDVPLPIGREQTISQPYVVAMMTVAIEPQPGDRVLEIGTGSGYAAAVLSRIVREVYSVERIGDLAESARERLRRLGCDNVQVQHADGTLGWAEKAPFDKILVTAGGPGVPAPLLEQLAVGGRLVIPVGQHRSLQKLIRTTKTGPDSYTHEDLGDVRFVPLVGTAGWQEAEPEWSGNPVRAEVDPREAVEQIRAAAEPFKDVESADLAPLLKRIGDSRLVLIGEASHGTSEFHSMRARITRALIEQLNFDFVAIEADWPDAARIDHYVRSRKVEDISLSWQAFERFPTWMWRNRETLEFIDWLREHNLGLDRHVGFYGLDLYSLYTSIAEVLAYLDRVDPEAAGMARERYGCLSPWEGDPATYGRAALSSNYQRCETEVMRMLEDLLEKRTEYMQRDGSSFFDATRNAALIANAEQYYRHIYYGGAASWNVRDMHMFETLEALLDEFGPDAKGIVWAHNSHVGDALATEMGRRDQINLGHLVRRAFGDAAYLIGQGTHQGTVAAAHTWGDAHANMRVRPSEENSYERFSHDSKVSNFFLALREPGSLDLRDALAGPHLERAIGVIYRPETEIQSHYYHASLPQQFDEWIWFDETHAIDAIGPDETARMTGPHPFAVIDR
ncbi:MAG: protein-L-isoaspartate(D-aspartate) O-methyltransferase [Planctomycetota bacterium]